VIREKIYLEICAEDFSGVQVMEYVWSQNGAEIRPGDHITCVSKGKHDKTAKITIGKNYTVKEICGTYASGQVKVQCDKGVYRYYNSSNFVTLGSKTDENFIKDLKQL